MWAYNKYGHLMKETFIEQGVAGGYYFCILASFKNNMYRLKEWIEHYIWQGVDHIYLVDDGSVDDYWTEIQAYIKSGLVTVDMFAEAGATSDESRDKAFQIYKDTSEWIAVIDTNTFMYTSTPDKSSVKDVLLKTADNVAAIYLYGKLFSSNLSSPCLRKSFTGRRYKPDDLPQAIVRTGLTWSLKATTHEHKPGGIITHGDGSINVNVYIRDVPTEIIDTTLSDAVTAKVKLDRCF